MSEEREGNNKFIKCMVSTLKELDKNKEKINVSNISRVSGYNKKEISLYLDEIENIMDALSIE